MADSSLILAVAQTDPLMLDGRAGHNALVRIGRHIRGLMGREKRGTSIKVFADGTALASATGTLTLSTASGSVGGTINGVTVTATASGGDSNSATLVANAINASTNALVQYLVTASAAGNVVTITSTMPGRVGNCITLAASGTGVTASGARLTGGAGGDVTPTTITL